MPWGNTTSGADFASLCLTHVRTLRPISLSYYWIFLPSRNWKGKQIVLGLHNMDKVNFEGMCPEGTDLVGLYLALRHPGLHQSWSIKIYSLYYYITIPSGIPYSFLSSAFHSWIFRESRGIVSAMGDLSILQKANIAILFNNFESTVSVRKKLGSVFSLSPNSSVSDKMTAKAMHWGFWKLVPWSQARRCSPCLVGWKNSTNPGQSSLILNFANSESFTPAQHLKVDFVAVPEWKHRAYKISIKY